jgi:hypothetical protein
MSVEAWFDAFEVLTASGTILVIVGLFKEYGVEDLLGVLTFWRKTFHPARVRVETWSERVGGLFVVLGIAIELVGGIGIFATSLRIETQHRRDIAALQSETAEAERKTEELRAVNLKLEKEMFGLMGRSDL